MICALGSVPSAEWKGAPSGYRRGTVLKAERGRREERKVFTKNALFEARLSGE